MSFSLIQSGPCKDSSNSMLSDLRGVAGRTAGLTGRCRLGFGGQFCGQGVTAKVWPGKRKPIGFIVWRSVWYVLGRVGSCNPEPSSQFARCSPIFSPCLYPVSINQLGPGFRRRRSVPPMHRRDPSLPFWTVLVKLLGVTVNLNELVIRCYKENIDRNT